MKVLSGTYEVPNWPVFAQLFIYQYDDQTVSV